jgi:hypothetical protein
MHTFSFCLSDSSEFSAMAVACLLAVFSFDAALFLFRMRASATFLISFVPVS